MRKSFGILLLIILGVLVGCSKLYIKEVDIVNFQIANNKVEQYMYRLQKGDIEGAGELTNKEISQKEKIDDSSLPIIAFDNYENIEIKDGVLCEVNVVRGKKDEIFCSLDKWFIKVERSKKGEYEITSIKSIVNKEIYVEQGLLKILESGNSKDNVVVGLDDLPREIYIKGQTPSINDSGIPLSKFDKLGISFSGDAIAFSTINEKDTFLGVAFMESARPAFSTASLAQSSSVSESDLKKDFNKPIAQKIIYLDLLKNSKVQKLLFSEELDALVVQFIDENNSPMINVYSLPDGDLLPLNLDKVFPADKYSVECIGSIKSEISIYVSKKPGIQGIHQALLGEYIIDLKKETIDKI